MSAPSIHSPIGLVADEDGDFLCPSCDYRVDEYGESIEEPNCVMGGWWSHASDCDECQAVICDGSC